MLKKILVIIFILHSCTARGQNYNFNNFSTENGLPTNSWQNVYADSFGFLWLASFDGLFRWDGYTIKKYTHDENNPASLDNNIVYTITEDKDKHLWIGTIDGLNLYDPKMDAFIKFDIRGNKAKIPINSIVADHKNQLWLGTSNGLCKFNFKNGSKEWITGNNEEDVIFCMAVDAEDDIWVGTFNKGIKKFSQTTHQFQIFNNNSIDRQFLSAAKIRSILVDKENNIWIGTEDKGIAVINTAGKLLNRYSNVSAKETFSQKSVSCIYEDKNNTIWIGVGRESVCYINQKDKTLVPITQGALNNAHEKVAYISSICEDLFGNIWFSSIENGLFYTNSSKNIFRNYLQNPAEMQDLKSKVVTSFCRDRRGKQWIGTNGSGMLQFDPVTKKLSRPANPLLQRDAVNDIKEDATGMIWIASWGAGLKQFDPITGLVKNYLHDSSDINSLIYNDVKALLPDDSLVWIGTHGAGLAAYDIKRHHFIHYKNNVSIPFNLHEPAWINHLFKDSKKRLWISTYSGLFVFDGKKLQHFEHSKDSFSISSNSVNMVTEDTNGKIWIVSEAGLDQYDTLSNFKQFTGKFLLPQSIKSIVAFNDMLWMSSSQGLLSFNWQTLKVNRFDTRDGLPDNTYFQKAVNRSSTGELYFGCPKGFTVFNPDSVKPLNIPSYFYFTDLYINNEIQSAGSKGSPLKKVLAFTDTLVLSPKQSFFSIGFVSINLYAPAKTKYAYQLKGLSDSWMEVKDDRRISFMNLPPGNYLLSVRYTDTKGEWQLAPKMLHMEVLPSWWQTWWFKVLAVLLIASAIITFFYFRLASIHRQNRMLEAKVKRRTNDLNVLNASLTEQNDEIKMQKETLEESNEEIMRQSNKILDQQQHIIGQNQALEDTVNKLEKLNNSKDHFFSILAHDLKNPVSALTEITGFIKDSMQKLEKKELEKYIDGMYKSSTAVYELLINLLNWSSSQSKKISCNPADTKLLEIVEKNAALMEAQLNNKHISMEIHVNNAHWVHADYNMLDAAIRNIISNSIKYTDYNGKVEIHSSEKEDSIILRITDTGIGMGKEQLDKLFNIDKTILMAGTAGEKGTGLGLIITKEFIEINKGHLWVESTPGKGSSFYIELPVAIPQENLVRPIENKSVHSRLTLDFWETLPLDKLIKLKGKKILIVDDNKEVREYLKLILSDTFEMFEAADGNEGLQIATESTPQVIITDLLMPGMSGLEFCRAIKSNSNSSHIPVVFLTSQWDEDVQVSGYEAGADVYLTKPVKKELLIQVILNLLQIQEKLHANVLANILHDKPFHSDAASINKLDEKFLNQIVDLIEESITDPALDARFICKKMNTSRTVLYSKIKALTGQTVHEFIKSIRLRKSLHLLLEGQLSINQVAFEVGFNSHSYFDKCFIKEFKMGPKEYINKKKGKEKQINTPGTV